MLDRTRHLYTSSLGTFALRIASAGLTYVTSIVLARLLGAEGFGVFSTVFALVSLLGLLSTIGTEHLMVRFIAAYRATEEWVLIRGLVQRISQLSVLISFVLLGGLALLARSGTYAYPDELLIASLFLPWIVCVRLTGAMLQGLRKVLLGLLSESVVLPAILLAIVLGLDIVLRGNIAPTHAVAAQVSAVALTAIISIFLVARNVPGELWSKERRYETRYWFGSAFPLLFIGGVNAIQQYFDILMVEFLRGPADAGLYRAAVQLGTLGMLGAYAVSRGIRPLMSELNVEGKIRELQVLITKAVLMVSSFAALSAVVLVAFSSQLLSLYGDEFVAARFTLILLCIGQTLIAASGLGGILLLMVGRESVVAKGLLLSIIANIALNLALIPKFGIAGAAFSTMASSLLAQLSFAVASHRGTGINPTLASLLSARRPD